ncbi:hypothetical protein GCK72_013845 [Caenorhabditis remanei]|uniref:RNase NYN domain-containing protein n=1 Tax=Caenorhabditis remanei TaxID=31234 RepID=E3M728_CAERE|nr:hypothetical protein GCK72_013845 [Caenorhabditis remanei]EFO93656.1 hypothetical protein CRE_12646 [Caenorhabditis remanei]KAF1757389.1 hypothetical protein GCK72_013845 [Caenorhabditis remanei]
MSISETDKLEYDALECKNITLTEFIERRKRKELENGRLKDRYINSLKKGPLYINRICSLSNSRLPPGTVPRTIVIDGANVMHCGSIYQDTREGSAQSIPDVASLLALMRYFIVRDFEVFAVLSRKYSKPDATNFKEAIDRLVENNLCVIVPSMNLDDTIALEFAAQVNGIVISSDKYRDHACLNPRIQRIVEKQRLNIFWDSIPTHHQNSRTQKGEMDYLPSKKFMFTDDNNSELSENDVIKTLYAFPNELQYIISKERHEMIAPEKRKTEVEGLLNDLISMGINHCQVNAKRILETPVHVPTDVHSKSRTFSEGDYLTEVPPDDQANHISLPFGESDDEW